MNDILAYLAFDSAATYVPVGRNLGGKQRLGQHEGHAAVGDLARGEAVFNGSASPATRRTDRETPRSPRSGDPDRSPFARRWPAKERAASFILAQHAAVEARVAHAAGGVRCRRLRELPRASRFSRQGTDWPSGGAPKDVPYATNGHEPHRPPASLLARRTPERAIVPTPPAVDGSAKREH